MGLNVNQKMRGLICPKHFRDKDLLRLPISKGNNNVQLVHGAIPIGDLIEKEEMEGMSQMSQISEIESRAPDSPSLTHDSHDMINSHRSHRQQCQQCEQCSIKDSNLINYEERIEVLQHDLKSAQNSLRYYKALSAKLKAQNLQMEKDNSINSELIKELQVGFIFPFLQTDQMQHMHHMLLQFECFALKKLRQPNSIKLIKIRHYFCPFYRVTDSVHSVSLCSVHHFQEFIVIFIHLNVRFQLQICENEKKGKNRHHRSKY